MNTVKRLLAEHRRASVTLAGTLLVLLLFTVSNLFSGLPDPREPSSDLFANPDETSWAPQDATNEAVTDFAERPLFSATRRTRVSRPAPTAVPKPEPAAPILSLDQWSLLGIFDSGEVEGALIRHPNSGRHRLVVGESVDGWELTSVDPRSVRFQSVAGGSQAELNMALATVEVLPVPSDKGGTASAATSTVEQRPEAAEAAEAAEVPEIITPNFGEFYGGPAEERE